MYIYRCMCMLIKLTFIKLHICLDRISAFQEDEFVRQALENGMDLREYALQIEQEREAVQRDLENDCKHYIKIVQNG